MTIANKGLRIINFAIDLIVISIVYNIVSLLINSFVHPGLFLYFIGFFYYLILESTIGQTIGKLITNTIVIDRRNSKPGFWRILFRTLLRYNPFDWMSYLLGFEPGAHDQFSGTRTIKKTN
ncbi:MAG: RDD family protein [Carboxylicivirga sp.]|jgi:uncharacterized RDD family membrane protein YckC|nr:RDD family protein [Carboxylicivirga sp.]